MLGVVFAVEYFRHYLEGKHFQLYTDHQALIHMLTKSENKNMWARWALRIQQFSFTIRHLKGKLNIPSDALSRRDYPQDKTPMTEPPPKPLPMRVQYRVMFKDTIQIQKYNDQDPPNTLYKLLPNPLLKNQSTHHFYCTCTDHEDTQTTHQPQSSTFSKLRQNHDIPKTKTLHKINTIHSISPCPMHSTQDPLHT